MFNHSSPTTTTYISRRTIIWGFGFLFTLMGSLLLAIFANNAWLDVVVLGTVEGITEFLPISSTGHLLVTSDLLGFTNSIGGTFEIFIQFGAVLAVLMYYARDLGAQARALPTSAAVRRFWLGIIIAFLPAAAVGLALRDWIKLLLFTSPTVIAWALIIGGIVLLIVERLPHRPTVREERAITLWQALSIGLAQVLALIPGVSRSGATIVGGMLSGLDRRTATAFSFYLALPTLGAATLVDLLSNVDQLTPGDLARLALGTITSLIVAWFAIGWLLRYVANHSFMAFGLYRIGAGLIMLVLVAAGWL